MLKRPEKPKREEESDDDRDLYDEDDWDHTF